MNFERLSRNLDYDKVLEIEKIEIDKEWEKIPKKTERTKQNAKSNRKNSNV